MGQRSWPLRKLPPPLVQPRRQALEALVPARSSRLRLWQLALYPQVLMAAAGSPSEPAQEVPQVARQLQHLHSCEA